MKRFLLVVALSVLAFAPALTTNSSDADARICGFASDPWCKYPWATSPDGRPQLHFAVVHGIAYEAP